MKFLERLDDNIGGIVAIVAVFLLIALLSYHCGDGLKEDLADRYNDGYEMGYEDAMGSYDDGRESGYFDGWHEALSAACAYLDERGIDDEDLQSGILSLEY